jgi:hypothetical protein
MKVYGILILVLVMTSCSTGHFNTGRIPDLDLHQIKDTEYRNLFGTPAGTTFEINSSGIYISESATRLFDRVFPQECAMPEDEV